jgi:hypothetical protein
MHLTQPATQYSNLVYSVENIITSEWKLPYLAIMPKRADAGYTGRGNKLTFISMSAVGTSVSELYIAFLGKY